MRGSLGAALPLLVLDASAIGFAWFLVAFLVEGRVFSLESRIGSPMLVSAVALFVLIGNHARGLYAEARADRALELVGCARSCVFAAITIVVLGKALGLEPAPWHAVSATGVCLVLLLVARSAYRARITVRRRANEAVRPAIVVGTNDEAFELCRLLDQDSAFGFRPWGVVGERGQYDRYPFDPPWLGDVDSIASVARDFGIDQVFVARTALSAVAFADLTRGLTSQGVHVAASSGLPSIDQRRLKVMPIAQMPVYCLGATGPSRLEAFVKRAVDVVVALVTLGAALPVMALTAFAILVLDGRPILFRQQRVGRNGVPFTLYKFRTMVPDAEVMMIDLLAENERQGPLFKLTRDPRVTRIGRFLRDSSLDELPQLLNVLSGKMSLVGPRPALVSETESFSEELLARNGARPGMTGLWQVEAGDDPSFVLYQHLDLYYVENWSTALDLAILVATIPTVVWRTVERLMRAHRKRLEGRAAAPVPGQRPAAIEPRPAEAELVALSRTPARPQAGRAGRALGAKALGKGFHHDVAVISMNGRAALPLGLAFARGGLSVVLHDPDRDAVELMNRGKMPLRGGAERSLLRSALREGRLAASADVGVISKAECLIIVLGGDRGTGHAGTLIVEAVRTIQDGLRDGQLLVLENSLDPAVAQEVEDLISGLGLSIDVAMCRERLSAYAALSEYGSVPQILCGRSAGALERAERLFRSRTALPFLDAPHSYGAPPLPASAGGGRPAAVDPSQLRGA
ncbi:MAG TPA: exopolysaccharide biosynthesis polyprenyl glycosylphosphotransferase [Actinomycetota bacterium]